MVEIYYLYEICNTVDGSKYIGITKDIIRRKHEHFNHPSNKYLKAAIGVYGTEYFVFNVISQHSLSEIDKVEKEAIKNARELGINLYNVALGGLIGNGSPGEEHWNHSISEQDAINIRILYAQSKCNQHTLASLFGLSNKTISKIVRGERWKSASGPITTTKPQISKVANRRKLTDVQVIQAREEVYQEYLALNTIDIPEVSKLYNISRQSMRLLLKGKSYTHLPGPRLGVDYYKEFGKV